MNPEQEQQEIQTSFRRHDAPGSTRPGISGVCKDWLLSSPELDSLGWSTCTHGLVQDAVTTPFLEHKEQPTLEKHWLQSTPDRV